MRPHLKTSIASYPPPLPPLSGLDTAPHNEMRVPQWSVADISFTSDRDYANP